MAPRYIPEAGDIVWLCFNPQAGHRPALVLSPSAYNRKTNLMICCPMTSQIKGYPFEVLIATQRPSAVLSDQVKSLDWVTRKAIYKGKVSSQELAEVRTKILTLISAKGSVCVGTKILTPYVARKGQQQHPICKIEK